MWSSAFSDTDGVSEKFRRSVHHRTYRQRRTLGSLSFAYQSIPSTRGNRTRRTIPTSVVVGFPRGLLPARDQKPLQPKEALKKFVLPPISFGCGISLRVVATTASVSNVAHKGKEAAIKLLSLTD